LERFPIRDDPETGVNEDNPGNGEFRFLFSLPNPLIGPTPGRFSVSNIKGVYAHIDPADPFHKSTEFETFAEIVQSGVPVPATQTSNHNRVEQNGLEGAVSEDQVLKTIRLTRTTRNDAKEELQTKYIARYRDDGDDWSGTVNSTDPGFDFNFDSACADIPSGLVIDQGNCLAAGIDIGEAGLQFLGFTERDDAAFPGTIAFPEDPTF
jgi:hypothetical protein